jgi:phosphoglucosamine mutase
VVAALSLLKVMVQGKSPLSDLTSVFEASPQELVNIQIPTKVPLEDLDPVQTAIREADALLGDDGRVLVRYSGTEMKARIMVEGPDPDLIGVQARRIADVLLQALQDA